MTLQKMSKQSLILQIMNQTDHCKKEKIKKLIALMKDELGGNILKQFPGLREKAYSYLIDDGSENKKAKGTKKCAIKRKLKLDYY